MFEQYKENTIKRIEDLINDSIDYETKTGLNFGKIKGDIEPGNKIEIVWNGYCVDYGYVFSLPNFHDDVWDLIVHIPEPYGEKEAGPPQWIHLIKLVSYERIKEIKVIIS